MHQRARQLDSELVALVGPNLLVTTAAPIYGLGDLLPAERAALVGAEPVRQQEFATGRVCARLLLARMGVTEAVLPMRDDRTPMWPAGFVGSISHTRDLCIVAVARRTDVTSIGIDVEHNSGLAEELWDLILTDSERGWLEHQPAVRRSRLATALFSAKESTYKCLYPWLRTAFEPRHFAVQWDGRATTFAARLLQAPMSPIDVDGFAGSLLLYDRWIVSTLIRHA